MPSNVLFLGITIFAIVLLLTAGITSVLGAEYIFDSEAYNKEESARSAHRNLTIAASLGWSAVIVLGVVLLVAGISGDFSSGDISEALLSKQNLSSADLKALWKGERELQGAQTTQIVLLIVLIMVAIVTLAVGVLAAYAAYEISQVKNQDTDSRAAYTQSIIAAVSGAGGIALMIVSVIVYVGIKTMRDNELEKIKSIEKQEGVVK